MPDYPLIAFYAFAGITLASAFAVILVRNPVHAALCLVLTFFSAACLWLLAQAEFLGIALVLVYVGAVMVLFLFVVMMLDIDMAPLREGFVRFLPVAAVVAGLMLFEMLTLMGIRAGRRDALMSAADPAVEAGTSNIGWIARALFSNYMLPFEIAAVILTVALIAAVVLTLRRRTGVKHQDPVLQVAVRARDRVRLVKMPAERAVGAKPEETAP